MRGHEFNLHGHIHGNKSPSERHICVCVEHIDFTPVSLDWVLEQIKQRSS
jgi:calcineurin-like phosphoesterase family protein